MLYFLQCMPLFWETNPLCRRRLQFQVYRNSWNLSISNFTWKQVSLDYPHPRPPGGTEASMWEKSPISSGLLEEKPRKGDLTEDPKNPDNCYLSQLVCNWEKRCSVYPAYHKMLSWCVRKTNVHSEKTLLLCKFVLDWNWRNCMPSQMYPGKYRTYTGNQLELFFFSGSFHRTMWITFCVRGTWGEILALSFTICVMFGFFIDQVERER